MSAHTPGLWMFYEDNNYGGTVELGGSNCTVSLDRADRFTSELVIGRDEMCANGRLIAESPALLALLKECLANSPGRTSDWRARAEKSIARAEGREP